MPDKDREARIAQAAYDLLAARGYGGTSMLAVAKAASASNETLYRWYGDKAGLVRALVAQNAAEARERLDRALADGADPLDSLAETAPILLAMLLSDRAILLNRAAAADATGAVGQALAEAGRGTIAPLVGDLMARAIARGEVAAETPAEAADLFLTLLIGDLQIRRATGALARPDADWIAARARTAVTRFHRLTAPPA